MNFEFSEEQYEFLEQVDRFLEENYDPEVMDPSRENMSQLVDTALVAGSGPNNRPRSARNRLSSAQTTPG